MVDKPQPAETKIDSEQPAVAPPAQPPRRAPGHRSTDARDTVAEMALRAQEISQEAGSKIAQAIKDVINAAAGLSGFAVESARDIVQYMVRRGQMTQEEADRIIREAEDANSKRKPGAKPPSAGAPSPSPILAPPPAPPLMAVPKSAPPPPKPGPVKAPAAPPRNSSAPAKVAPVTAKRAKAAPARKAAAKPAAKKKPAAGAKPKSGSRASGKKKR